MFLSIGGVLLGIETHGSNIIVSSTMALGKSLLGMMLQGFQGKSGAIHTISS